MQNKIVVTQSILQARRPTELKTHRYLFVVLGAIEMGLVAALALGNVTSNIGVGQSFTERWRGLIQDGNADAAINFVASTVVRKCVVLQDLTKLLGGGENALTIHVVHENGEFIAA